VNKVKLEALIKENPGAAAAAAMATVMLMNKDTGRKNKAITALRDRDNPAHEKAVGIFQKFKDKFTQKKKEKAEKQRKADIDVALKKMGITPKMETIAMKSRTDKELGENKMKLESLLKENPAAMAAMHMVLLTNPQTGRKIKATTALVNKRHPSHEKAVGIFQRILNKFKKKEEPKKKEDEPKKQSPGGSEYYSGFKVPQSARTGNELDESVKMHTISGNKRFMTKTAIPIMKKYGIKNMKANSVGGYFLELRFLIDSNKLKELDKELKRKNKTAYGGIVENRKISIDRRDKMKEEILRKVIREEIKRVINEDDKEAFSQPIPAQIERYMKKFIAAVQGAKLNRRRTGAILGRVVAAMNIEPGDLMRYVRLVKKGL
jgi:hypothetical protein